MLYIKLFLTFLKIGLFMFGGGYVAIPLVQKE
ncbi:MAG: chromate transporter, partial [Elusimicrobiota bacterium]|nr:chromate transporter [Elusimicrobiota bacterium]